MTARPVRMVRRNTTLTHQRPVLGRGELPQPSAHLSPLNSTRRELNCRASSAILPFSPGGEFVVRGAALAERAQARDSGCGLLLGAGWQVSKMYELSVRPVVSE